MDSDIAAADAASESDVSGSFDNNVNPHNGDGDDGDRQPGGQGKTPFTTASSEALVVGGPLGHTGDETSSNGGVHHR